MRIFGSLMAVAAMIGVTPLAAQSIRVGIFHQPSIVVAYYRSPMWADVLKPKMTELQETSHKQLAGEAPITNILEALQPAFPEIARAAHVELIAADLPYASRTVETGTSPISCSTG